ncbi:hypothetical protein DFH08DRAFT_810214 [Mycena albidolilacea]|uniref:Uncharacterized protein n=1 Tax=Mycena albidolilacea TaxID=1033008 RepID=A0AAD7EQJ5_9AGAR|nr:hypothetical protein DFH08DRAFT_810214 [Mycena albidolilacea]
MASEIRLYKRQKSLKRPSTSCCLFIAARYIGLIYVIWVTNVFFVKWASLEVCRRIAPVGGILRGFLSSLSAAIFVRRTWVIWARNRPALTSTGGCTDVSRGTGPYALVNLIFDTVVCSLGTYKLLKNVKGGQSRISTVLLADGIIYFVIAVTIQATNLAFLLSPDPAVQGTFLTMQTITTAILGQRISKPSYHFPGRTHDKHGIQPLGLDADARPLRFRLARTRALGGMGMGCGVQADQVELSMMKIEVNTSKHVHEDESLPGMEKPDTEYP